MAIAQISYAQKACCSKTSSEKSCCKPGDKNSKACCSTTGISESTSGCTPSNCRGAKTKFGEAKVISNLRLELIALKAKMENHDKLDFSESAISVHDIIGETDEQSLNIIAEHVSIIQSELITLTKRELPVTQWSENKAKKVQQLNEQIVAMKSVL